MRLKHLEINGFKSFAKKTTLDFKHHIVSVVGPNGSGKSNVVEAFRFVLGEQSMKSMRGKTGGDMIFKGSKNLSKGSRASVTVEFDNSDKIFKLSNENGENVNLNYDTITISREVYPDGLNKYSLNGTEVRLKDIHNLLHSVHIGASSHHIISQGEADRILNASSKDRREMIEDALGLKVYQYKIKDAERKLERSEENMKEVTLQKRENLPHLKFLQKQVEKFEKAREMKDELVALYKEYLKKESIYLEHESQKLKEEKEGLQGEIAQVREIISKIEDTNPKESENINKLKELEHRISEIQRVKDGLERKLGRLEGMIEAVEGRSEVVSGSTSISIPREDFEFFYKEMHEYLEEAMTMDIIDNVAPILGKIKDILDRFSTNFDSIEPKQEDRSEELENLKNTRDAVAHELLGLKEEQNNLVREVGELKGKINVEMGALRDQEREKFSYQVKLQEFSSALSVVNIKGENLANEKNSFENEIKEGHALVGLEISNYEAFELPSDFVINKQEQEELRRKIERIKIKLEDAGLGGEGEVVREFEEVTKRDEFLTKELLDLEKSIEGLENLIQELKDKIDVEFKDGIKKINKEFTQFFALMFGGGEGLLNVVMESKRKRGGSGDTEEEEVTEEEIEFEQGIEINVSLPHKKVKELQALSGGERSLTSIALLFAMSFVNPPPFLILDETDAALDEANSRKYGDMLERLSKHSQLIVVTHNRETMSRAGILYGVTIGSDGASKLLSVKFDEAQAIAK